MSDEFSEGFKRVQANPKELYAFFMQAPAPLVIFTGAEHRISLANPLYERMVGRKVMGKRILEAFTQEEVGDFIELLDRVFDTGEPYEGSELPLVIPNEQGELETRFLNVAYHAHRDLEGRIDGVFAIHQDVTDQVLARRITENAKDAVENERANFRELFRQSAEMVCILRGPEHRFEFVNEAHIKALGFDATGMAVREAQPESVEVHGLLDDVYRTGKTAHLTELPVTLTDRVRYFQLTYSARRNHIGEIDGVMIVGQEITEQVLQRENLKRLKDEAERANAYKSAFLANMSHEIRTPLGAMIGFADLLRDPNLGADERADYLNILTRNAESLSVIIDDILDLSKVEAGELMLEHSDTCPKQVVEDVAAMLSAKIKAKGLAFNLRVEASTPRRIVSDPQRLRQMLLNLIGNSLKFTSQGSISVHVSGCEGKDGRPAVCFDVTDTGIGIAPEKRDRVFEVFVQADDSTTRKFGGTGLGLTLSRSLARSLGGDIVIERTELGKGTTFRMIIVDQPELRSSSTKAEKEATRPSLGQKVLRGKKVLIVDDSEDNRSLISLYLAREGAESAMAENGAEAVKLALSGAYDVILMDLQMPVMDGYTATAKLRTLGYKKPIVALTAHAMAEVRDRVLKAGANAHLHKPINPRLLIETVAQQTFVN